MRRKIILSFVTLALLAQPAMAVVRISNMNDFAFGTWSGAGQLQSTDRVCIHDSVNTNYRIRASGSGAGGAFTITGAGLPALAYTVSFRGSVGGFVNLTSGVSSAAITAANTASSTCGGGTNADLRVTISNAALSAADAGNYSGTLTVLLQP